MAKKQKAKYAHVPQHKQYNFCVEVERKLVNYGCGYPPGEVLTVEWCNTQPVHSWRVVTAGSIAEEDE